MFGPSAVELITCNSPSGRPVGVQTCVPHHNKTFAGVWVLFSLKHRGLLRSDLREETGLLLEEEVI